MEAPRRKLFCVFSALAFAVAAPAQGTLDVSPDSLEAEGQAEIGYSNPKRAGETIIVEIDDGGSPRTQTDSLEIELDASGEGSTTWKVPDWDGANFNAPDATEVTRWILRPIWDRARASQRLR